MKRFFLIVLCAMLLSFSCAHGEEPGGDIPLSGTIQDTQPGSDLPEGESGGFSAGS